MAEKARRCWPSTKRIFSARADPFAPISIDMQQDETAGGLDAAMNAACDSQAALEARDAAAACRDALRADPGNAAALNQLGLLAHLAGANQVAQELIRRAIVLAPRHAGYLSNLGIVLLGLCRFDAAQAALRSAIRLERDNFPAQANLGVALKGLGRYDDAIKAYGAALRLKPGDPATLCNRGLVQQAAGRYDEALATLQASLRGNPDDANTCLALGNLLAQIGRTTEALAAIDMAIRLRPHDLPARHARVLTMNYLPDTGMAAIGAVARYLAPVATGPAYDPSRIPGFDLDPERRLRIGFVSADLHDHPVAYFLESVLASMDRTRTEVFCYDNSYAHDAVTARFVALAEGWRPIAGMPDVAVTELIRADRIDILVDLSGHTHGSRLGVFANRAASVQASWLGYFGTTGVAAMDYIIADRHVAPPGEDAYFSETVIRLPDSYLCFTPPAYAGPVAPLPAGADGPVTFGCFNNPAKLNPAVLALWSRVLAAVPRSRLLLKATQYRDKTLRRTLSHGFAAHGIGPERLLFESAGTLAEMFAAYGRMDIALDPFPFAGGATTAQALWMGVPVISLAAATWPGRQGASLLTAAGFPELVAANPDSYVATARVLAEDRIGLAALRCLLRDRMAASPLCRADLFAANLTDAFRDMWRRSMQAV
jgi:predicted O-linked N-acetylglucosamine transferase (SPINDLY family)